MSEDLPDLEPIDLRGEVVAPPAPPTGFGAPGTPGGDAWPPGWYADPWTAGQYRLWNGQTWTGETHRTGPTTAPTGTGVWPASPPVRDPAGGMSASGAPLRTPGGYGPGPGAPVGPTPPYGRPRGRMAAVVAALVVLVLIAGSVGYAIESHSRSKKTAANVGPTTPTTGAPGPPATAPNPAERSVLSRIVVQQSDVTGTREVVLIQNGNRLTQPTLDLCNGTFSSEQMRVARLQVADVDPSGDASLSTEAVVYRDSAATALAFSQLRTVSAACPHAPVKSPVGEGTAETQFNAPPDKSWAKAPAGVDRLAYSFVTTEAGTKSPSIAVYLRRGRVLLGLYFPNPNGAQPPVAGKTTIEGIVGVFETRMAQLPAALVVPAS